MSLYVGNLSPGVRLDELERVFQKFGRCSLRMKGGYGFVVYEFPPNAERALRALQDKYICGEQLTLTWSNRQPGGAFRGAVVRGGGASSFGMMRNGGFRERIVGRDRGEGRRGSYREFIDREAVDDRRGNVVGEGVGRGEDVNEDGEPLRIIDDDRWGNGAGTENEKDVARYEPSRDYGKIEYGMNRSTRAVAKQGCYQCGAVGHKMRDCHRGDFSGRRFYRFDHRRDEENKRKDRGEEEIDRSGSRPKKRLCSSQDSGPVGGEMSGKSPHSVQQRWSRRDGSTPTRNGADNSQKNDHEGKRLRREETEDVKECSTKKEKSSISARVDSDDSLFRSNSKSHSSNHRRRGYYSRSRSRSISSRAHSTSYSSRSSTPRRNHRANGSKYKSRSVSPILSLSVSTGQPLASLPNTVDNENALKEAVTEQSRMVEAGVLSEDAKPENFPMETNNEHATLPPELGKMEQDGPPEENTENIEIVLSSADEVDRENSDPGDGNIVDAGNSFQQRLTGTKDFQNCDGLMNDKLPTLPSKMCETEQGGTPEENAENREIVLGSADEVARESRDPGDDAFVDAGNCVEQRLTGTKDSQNSDGSITERPSHSLINPKDRDTSYTRSSTNISSKELSMVLKHYGHSILDESSLSLYPEDYFGSARLWPWGVIFYRRLKKGPISLQNYARRVEQNKEFGITDKYIRRSSGWGEVGQGNL